MLEEYTVVVALLVRAGRQANQKALPAASDRPRLPSEPHRRLMDIL
jgi:hypothetical protein